MASIVRAALQRRWDLSWAVKGGWDLDKEGMSVRGVRGGHFRWEEQL